MYTVSALCVCVCVRTCVCLCVVQPAVISAFQTSPTPLHDGKMQLEKGTATETHIIFSHTHTHTRLIPRAWLSEAYTNKSLTF